MNKNRKYFLGKVVFITVFLCSFSLYSLKAESSQTPSTVLTPPYNEYGGALSAQEDVLLAGTNAKANASTGFMGVFGSGWIGGGASEAGLWLRFYVPKDMHLDVTATIHYMGGISGFGFGECSGFKFKWKINEGDYHEEQMEGGLNAKWVAEKTFKVASLATSAISLPPEYETINSISELMDMLSYIQTFQEFLLVMSKIETAFENAETKTVSFGFDAKKGWNEIRIAMRGEVSAVLTGFATYTVIGYLESLRIDGLGYPDLVIDGWSVTSQESWRAPMPEVGKPAKLKFKVQNKGNLESEATQVEFTIGNQTSTRHVSGLEPDQKQEYEYNFIFPQEQVNISVHADPDDEIFEYDYNWGKTLQDSYEQLNIPAPAQNVYLTKGGNLLEYRVYGTQPFEPSEADLGFEGMSPAMQTEDGESSHLVYKVMNYGGTGEYNWCKTAENIKVQVKIPEINWQDSKIISSLESGESKEVVFNTPAINRPQNISKSAGWGVKVEWAIDPANKIKERNEKNNIDVSYITVEPIRLPQLSVENLKVLPKTSIYQEGQSITLRADIEYWGKKPSKNIEVGFYYNKGEWGQPPDLELISKKEIKFDKKGVKSTSVIWPVWKSEYIYTDLYCIVDPDNKIDEVNESEDIHSRYVGIEVKKKVVEEKPLEERPEVAGVDLTLEDKDLFLESKNLIVCDYLGAWVHNRGDQDTYFKTSLTASWIDTDSRGGKKAVTKALAQMGDNIKAGTSKLIKFYFKNLSDKRFAMSKQVKFTVEARAAGEVDYSNNKAFLKIGDFDAVAQRIKEEEEHRREEYFAKPDLTIVDIKNLEPPLKVGRYREFQIVIKNKSNLDASEAYINCVIRPKGSGRPHPELGWKEYKKHIAPLKAGQRASVFVEYKPIRKGVYEIVASVGSIKYKKRWGSDADRSNDHLLKYFGIETMVKPEPEEEERPSVTGKRLDLAVEDIWVDNETPNVGEVITGGFVVHNYSKASLNNLEWKVYSNNNEIASGIINEIGSDCSLTVNTSSKADKEGIFTVKAVVDPGNKIKEINENNNFKEIKVGIEEESLISLPQVDLAIVSLKLKKSTLKIGDTTKAVARIKNLGKDTAHGVPVNFQVNEKSFFVTVIEKINRGEVKTISAPIIGLLGGSHTIKVTIDKKNLIKELNESNNQKSVILKVESLIKSPQTRKTIKDIFNIFNR